MFRRGDGKFKGVIKGNWIRVRENLNPPSILLFDWFCSNSTLIKTQPYRIHNTDIVSEYRRN